MSVLLALAMQVAAQPIPSVPAITVGDLNAMADACRAPREWLELRGNEIVFRASPNEDEAKIVCVLKKIDAVVASSSLSSVGTAPVSKEK